MSVRFGSLRASPHLAILHFNKIVKVLWKKDYGIVVVEDFEDPFARARAPACNGEAQHILVPKHVLKVTKSGHIGTNVAGAHVMRALTHIHRQSKT